MWKSRDFALIILIAVVTFVFTIFVGQLAWLFTGIPGSNMLFSIGYAILISFALLMFEGRRWRFFVHSILVVFLTLPTYLAGTPFDVVIRMPLIINAFHGDLLFNSIYGFFEKRNKLLWWAILIAVEYMLMNPFLGAMIWPLFYPPEFVATMVSAILLLLPVIIIECVAGGYLGYKIYERVKKLV